MSEAPRWTTTWPAWYSPKFANKNVEVVLATAYDALAEKVAELTKRAESAEALYWAVAKMLSNAGDYSDAPDDDDAVVIAADYNAVVAAHLAHKPSNSAKGEHFKSPDSEGEKYE
jgi:predicted house-cleaning NTP pyrophosphatase (Maf/HAM1 superfamily)